MKELSKWKYLRNFLLDRLKSPARHPEFILYFILIIIGFGSIGVYISIFCDFSEDKWERNITLSMSSYFFAIVSTEAVELLFVKDKYIRNAILLIAILTLAICVVLVIVSFNVTLLWAFIVSGIGILLAWIVWWIANAENANLCDDSFFQKLSSKSKSLDQSLDEYTK